MKDGQRQLICVTLLGAVWSGLLGARPNITFGEPTAGDAESVIQGNAEFALDLYASLRHQSGNLFLSPYSISTALAMTYAGARGETASQMTDVLHFTLAQDRLHPAFAAMMLSDEATTDESGYRLHVANALWGQQGYGFLEEFLALNKKHYGAGFGEVDFVHAAEQARQTINRWVDDQTQHMIKELIHKGDMDPADVLVLTNAIYFKGDWASRFNKQHTADGPFRLGAGGEVVVPMMYQVGRFGYAATDTLDVLELPYDGDRLSMVLLLPKEIDGLAALEESLNKESLDGWLGRLHTEPVRVRLPRFKLGARFDLAKTLEAMGMSNAFNGAKADFSGMTGRRDLWIGMVIHEARIEVNEDGSEAAAATAVKMKRGPAPTEFTADRPFLFLIRDKQSGSILFIGRVANPKE